MTRKIIRKETLKKVRRIVVKVGSSILASRDRGLHRTVFFHLAREISALQDQGYEILLVSSKEITI